LKIFLPFRRAFSAISLRARICCTVLLSLRNPAKNSNYEKGQWVVENWISE